MNLAMMLEFQYNVGLEEE